MQLLNMFSLKLESCSEESVSTADGAKQLIAGSVQVPIVLDGVLKLVKLWVVPSVTHMLILGSDFCRQFELSLDFAKGSFQISTGCKTKKDEFPMALDVINVIKDRSGLNYTQRNQLDSLVDRFKELSWMDGTKLGRTHVIKHRIDTADADPIKQRQYPLSPYMLAHLNAELDRMLSLGVVQRSTSPWSSPVLLVKKANGELRFCFDGRRLNSVTKRDAYPLPLVDHILSKLSGAQYLTSIDLKSAFWQIPLEKSSCEKTAFSVPGRGLFEFVVMPFGLNNAPQTQQRLMDQVLGPDLDPFVFVYLDDIIIATPTFNKHVEVLSEVHRRLSEANLTINVNKCEFCRSSLSYLGFIIDKEGLRTNPDKVTAMLNYPVPRTATEIKRFIGLCSWYRRFIPHFSTITAPITELIKGRRKSQKIQWSDAAERSFQSIKQALVAAPVLAAPDFDQPFIIQSDASDVGVGAVLVQEDSAGNEIPIAFASRTLSAAERKYSVTEKECLAVLFAVEKFRPYVEGVQFRVVTDHHSLLWLNRLKDPVGRLARWAVKLQQFDMVLEHRKGAQHIVPDALSRAPLEVNILEVRDEDVVADRWYQHMVAIVGRRPDRFPLFDIREGRLYKHIRSDFGHRNNATEWKLVIPKHRRKDVMKSCHDDPLAAHLGIFKTINRVCDLYYWPGMRKDIKTYVRKCKICAAQKVSNQARPGFMGQEKRVSFPWQIIACDIIGPLPRSSKGFAYLLVITDWFTKFTILRPLRQAAAIPIARCLEEEVFLMFGAPQIIMLDNGTEFSANRIKELAREYGVKIWANARYHSQVNFVERYNRTVGAAIRSYLDGADHRDWDRDIQKIAFALRTAVHESTGFSPAFLNFGRYVPANGSFYGRLRDRDEINPEVIRECHRDALEELPEIHHEVQRRLAEAYERNAKSYNRDKRPPDVYRVGDRVWKRNYTMSSSAKHVAAKLNPKFSLAIVRTAVSNLVYELEDTDGHALGRWHVKDLKPYHGSNSSLSDSTDSEIQV